MSLQSCDHVLRPSDLILRLSDPLFYILDNRNTLRVFALLCTPSELSLLSSHTFISLKHFITQLGDCLTNSTTFIIFYYCFGLYIADTPITAPAPMCVGTGWVWVRVWVTVLTPTVSPMLLPRHSGQPP
jgi:hypothetical protein